MKTLLEIRHEDETRAENLEDILRKHHIKPDVDFRMNSNQYSTLKYDLLDFLHRERGKAMTDESRRLFDKLHEKV